MWTYLAHAWLLSSILGSLAAVPLAVSLWSSLAERRLMERLHRVEAELGDLLVDEDTPTIPTLVPILPLLPAHPRSSSRGGSALFGVIETADAPRALDRKSPPPLPIASSFGPFGPVIAVTTPLCNARGVPCPCPAACGRTGCVRVCALEDTT